MLLLLRRLKHGVYMNREFRKYLLYAFGEMMLVIVGILIALQIDNWNTDRQEQALLDGYLQSIARNMQEDAVELEALRETRVSSLDRPFLSFVSGQSAAWTCSVLIESPGDAIRRANN